MLQNLYISLPSTSTWGYRQARRYPLISSYKLSLLLNFYLLFSGSSECVLSSLLETGVMIHE